MTNNSNHSSLNWEETEVENPLGHTGWVFNFLSQQLTIRPYLRLQMKNIQRGLTFEKALSWWWYWMEFRAPVNALLLTIRWHLFKSHNQLIPSEMKHSLNAIWSQLPFQTLLRLLMIVHSPTVTLPRSKSHVGCLPRRESIWWMLETDDNWCLREPWFFSSMEC